MLHVFSFFKNRFRRAAEEFLAGERSSFGDLGPLKTRRDAEAVLWCLHGLPEDRDCYELALLFQDSDSPAAIGLLQERGVSLLLRRLGTAMPPTQLVILKVAVTYRTLEGTEAVIAAACQGLVADDPLWSKILRAYLPDHPYAGHVFRCLRDPLPRGEIAVGLASAATRALENGAPLPHPFDSPEGLDRLGEWICLEDVERVTEAVTALAFVKDRGRVRELLKQVAEHPSPKIRMVATWVLTSLGDELGLLESTD